MTFEERIDRLTERHEALSHTVELTEHQIARNSEVIARNEEQIERIGLLVAQTVNLVEQLARNSARDRVDLDHTARIVAELADRIEPRRQARCP